MEIESVLIFFNILYFGAIVSLLVFLIYGTLTLDSKIRYLIENIKDPEIKGALNGLDIVYIYNPFLCPGAVAGNSHGFRDLVINRILFPFFNDEMKKLILYHEALHVILKHEKFSPGDRMNRACDIVVNQMLIDVYKFDEKKLRYLVTYKNQFSKKKRKEIEIGQSEEYYYEKLEKKRR